MNLATVFLLPRPAADVVTNRRASGYLVCFLGTSGTPTPQRCYSGHLRYFTLQRSPKQLYPRARSYSGRLFYFTIAVTFPIEDTYPM